MMYRAIYGGLDISCCILAGNRPSLSFFLEVEERIASHYPELPEEVKEGGLFFVWQSPPTVICGRNQDIGSEVDMDLCREKGIEVVRRKSGGGAVYSDSGNVMVSFILKRGEVADTFMSVLGRMARFLRGLSLDAEVSGRNDILVGGRKVSGNAFFQAPGASIVHGTMLFDSDMEVLGKVLTPSGEKLSSHGVSSVRQRVANLRPLLQEAGNPMELEAFKEALSSYLGCETFDIQHYI